MVWIYITYFGRKMELKTLVIGVLDFTLLYGSFVNMDGQPIQVLGLNHHIRLAPCCVVVYCIIELHLVFGNVLVSWSVTIIRYLWFVGSYKPP